MISYNELIKHSGNHHLIEASEIGMLSVLKGIPFHIHAEGPRGTGKTTILRSIKNVLPKIERIRGCEYNCYPAKPHCPVHKDLGADEVKELGVEYIDIPFFEISHTAKPGTVAGSIDLKRLTDSNNPMAALLPGIIPRAHRGIIFVDEINRLADTSPELADILLDVMGTKPGRIQIEETGLEKVELSVSVSVWAASNPDEDPGRLEDIRRQLSDRFDFSVLVERPREREVVEKILNNDNFLDVEFGTMAEQDKSVGAEMINLSKKYDSSSELDKNVEKNLAYIYVEYKLESLRALKALRLGSLLKSSLKGKDRAELSELIEVTPMALKHRVDKKTLSNIMEYLRQERAEPATPRVDPKYQNNRMSSGEKAENKKKGDKNKNFFQRLLDKLRISGKGSNQGIGNQQGGAGNKCKGSGGNSGAEGGNSKGQSQGGSGGGSTTQLKPDENTVKSPHLNAKPLSYLLDEEIVKKGEREE